MATNATNKAATFQAQFDTYKKWSNLIVLPLGVILLCVTVYHFTGILCFVTVVMLLAGILPNFWWFVPNSYFGIQKINGTQLEKTYKSSVFPRWKIPFISTTSLEKSKGQIILKDTKKIMARNEVELETTVDYDLVVENAHWLTSVYNDANLTATESLKRLIDSAIDTVVGKLDYPYFQGRKERTQDWMAKYILYTVASTLAKHTEETGKSFETIAYSLEPVKSLVPNPDKDPTNPADAAKPDFIEQIEFEDIMTNSKTGKVERVAKYEMVETPVILQGVRVLGSVTVNTNMTNFEKVYEDAMKGVKEAEAKLEQERINAEATRVKADAAVYAKLKIAEAQAEEARMLTESLGGDAAAASQFLAAKAMSGLQGTYVQGGGAGVVVQGSKPKP